MKNMLLVLALTSLSFALYPGNVTVEPFEYRNFGNASEPDFTLALSMHCPSGTIFQHLESGGIPVAGAKSHLKYMQYQAPLISSGTTGLDGNYTHRLPGNVLYYTGIFILTVEKPGYQNHEAHFEISGCFVNVSAPPPAIAPPPINTTPEPEPNLTISTAEPDITPTINNAANATGPNISVNDSGAAQPDSGQAPPCPFALIGLAALLAGVFRN